MSQAATRAASVAAHLPLSRDSMAAAVQEGENYAIHVARGGPDVTLQMANLVTHDGDKVVIRGTEEDDLFEFGPGSAPGQSNL